jgi:SAM-dependent methyltransferase
MQTADRLSPGSSGPRAFRAFTGQPEGLCCPQCRTALHAEGANAQCSHCGRTAVIHGGRIPDFLAGEERLAEAVLNWPDAFIRQAEPWLLAVTAGKPVGAEASAELEAQHLLVKRPQADHLTVGDKSVRSDPAARLTPLGCSLAYHCAEFSVQSTKEKAGGFLEEFVQLASLGTEATVLDVGCGAGQTLRLLRSHHPAERVGLDIDVEALAFGCRLAESRGEAIHFVRGSAYQIPFRDGRFSHVICRVALNYVQQRRALREMVRVLQPGGFLGCTVEGPGYDLQLIRQAHGAAQLLARLRELAHGLALAATGLQAAPGSRWTGGRAFVTVRRCSQALAQAGCEIIHAKTVTRYVGLPVGVTWIARKA